MAASLRAAATRILRPAVLPGEGLRRLVHTDTKHSGFRASQFKQQKEELYDLIAKASANSATTWRDRLMLHHLCTQIEPRPNDAQWRKVIGIKKGIAYTAFTGCVATTVIAVFGLAPKPKIVEYEGHLVTAESVPMIQERLRKQERAHVTGGVAQANGLKTKCILVDGEARRISTL